MAEEYHYPPELFELLVGTIPLLVKGKKDVLTFFKGSGVEPNLMTDVTRRVDQDKDSIKKHEIARTVLERLNERGDATLRARREVVRRVVEFEDFSACWLSDQLKAKGLVAQIRQVVNVKDSFTRMREEMEREQRERRAERQAKLEREQRRRERITAIKSDLFSLFKEQNPHRRGKLLEAVLNRLFAEDGILLKEAFTITGDEGEGIIEQIDGVIEIDGEVYLVEMKWWDKPLGVGDLFTSHYDRWIKRIRPNKGENCVDPSNSAIDLRRLRCS